VGYDKLPFRERYNHKKKIRCCSRPLLIHVFIINNSPQGRSQWPRGVRCRSAAERMLGSWVRIPPGAWMFVSCTVFVLSGRSLCDRPIPRPEESYRLWCVSERDEVKINNLDTCCEQVGRRGKDCETKLYLRMKPASFSGTFARLFETVLRHIAQDNNLHTANYSPLIKFVQVCKTKRVRSFSNNCVGTAPIG
jgi:hypothetical protein